MRPEADVYSYVQDLEKHLQMTLFGGMAEPEWALKGGVATTSRRPGDGISHTVRPGVPGPRVSPAAVA